MSDEEVIYEKNQVKNILRAMNKEGPYDWFILGGPADGNEAQYLNKVYPHIQIVGFEPNPRFYKVQKERLFPGKLVPAALWGCPTTLAMERITDDLNGDRSASVVHRRYDKAWTVEAVMLDEMSLLYGPFNNAMVWLDIEGAEMQAMIGAMDLFERRAIKLLNLEVFKEKEEEYKDFLAGYGLKEYEQWGHHDQTVAEEGGRRWCNIIYKLEE